MSDVKSVRRAAAEIVTLGLPLAGLLNNAGIMPNRPGRSAQGWDTAFATNHLGPFAFTEALIPHLPDGANVVFTCSGGGDPERKPAVTAGFRGGRYISAEASARPGRRHYVARLRREAADTAAVYGLGHSEALTKKSGQHRLDAIRGDEALPSRYTRQSQEDLSPERDVASRLGKHAAPAALLDQAGDRVRLRQTEWLANQDRVSRGGGRWSRFAGRR